MKRDQWEGKAEAAFERECERREEEAGRGRRAAFQHNDLSHISALIQPVLAEPYQRHSGHSGRVGDTLSLTQLAATLILSQF